MLERPSGRAFPDIPAVHLNAMITTSTVMLLRHNKSLFICRTRNQIECQDAAFEAKSSKGSDRNFSGKSVNAGGKPHEVLFAINSGFFRTDARLKPLVRSRLFIEATGRAAQALKTTGDANQTASVHPGDVWNNTKKEEKGRTLTPSLESTHTQRNLRSRRNIPLLLKKIASWFVEFAPSLCAGELMMHAVSFGGVAALLCQKSLEELRPSRFQQLGLRAHREGLATGASKRSLCVSRSPRTVVRLGTRQRCTFTACRGSPSSPDAP